MGAVRFSIPEELALWARDAGGIDLFIETGTNRAATAAWAANHFRTVITIEGQVDLFSAAKTAHEHRRNIRFLLGDSRIALGQALAEMNRPAVLWLDAHWCGTDTYGPTAECPVMAELAAVNDSHPGHIILIDDARLFTAPPPPPHNAGDWPGLIELISGLNSADRPRYAAIFEDVIVAVPLELSEALIAFLRQPRAPSRSLTSERAYAPRTFLDRVRRASVRTFSSRR